MITSTNTLLLFSASQLSCSFRCRQWNSVRPTFEEHLTERVTAKWSRRSSGESSPGSNHLLYYNARPLGTSSLSMAEVLVLLLYNHLTTSDNSATQNHYCEPGQSQLRPSKSMEHNTVHIHYTHKAGMTFHGTKHTIKVDNVSRKQWNITQAKQHNTLHSNDITKS